MKAINFIEATNFVIIIHEYLFQNLELVVIISRQELQL